MRVLAKRAPADCTHCCHLQSRDFGASRFVSSLLKKYTAAGWEERVKEQTTDHLRMNT
jgi:hypothetical protein